MDLQPHIEKFADRMAEVETELGDPKVFENNRRAQEQLQKTTDGHTKQIDETGSAKEAEILQV